MTKDQFNTPILLIAFNRPETTKIVFEEIRKVRPKNFFMAEMEMKKIKQK